MHIDFGFILEISPGGNMGFESAAFKLSHEMTQLLDPGGARNSAHFRLFEELVVRGYLAVSPRADSAPGRPACREPCLGAGAAPWPPRQAAVGARRGACGAVRGRAAPCAPA